MRREKLRSRASAASSTYKMVPNPGSTRNMHDEALLRHQAHETVNDDREFDPYQETDRVDALSNARPLSHAYSYSEAMSYGGGSWTHEDIAREEKSRVGEQGISEEDEEPYLTEEEQRRRDEKSPSGPRYYSRDTADVDELPKYAPTIGSHGM
jgi:hypothetical protein